MEIAANAFCFTAAYARFRGGNQLFNAHIIVPSTDNITIPLSPRPSLLLTVHGLPTSNTFAVYGNGVDKELTELVPGILNQLGPDSLASLRKLAESYQAMNAQHAASQAAVAAGSKDDDDVPDVVENFDEADKKETDVDKLD